MDITVGQVRIIADSEKAVRQLANHCNVKLTTVKSGRDGGVIGYGTAVCLKITKTTPAVDLTA